MFALSTGVYLRESPRRMHQHPLVLHCIFLQHSRYALHVSPLDEPHPQNMRKFASNIQLELALEYSSAF